MNKKALSEMIAYVLLIVIAITISVIVYSFLKAYIWTPEKECPGKTGIVIEDYRCMSGLKIINITLRNAGNFNIDGMVVRAANKSGGLASKPLNEKNKNSGGQIVFDFKLEPGMVTKNYMLDYSSAGKIVSIEVEAFRVQDGEPVVCTNSRISQEITGCV